MDIISKAGDIQIEALEIISANNRTIDVSAQLIEINIFEDLYSEAVSGTLMLHDSFNFLINLPITGEEQLHIRARTPSLNPSDAIDCYFSIFKVSDKIIKDRSLVYQIHFISIEAIMDSNKAISRAFGGRISNMITDVLRQSIFLGTSKAIKIEETSNSCNVVPAFWSPFKLINYLTKRALNTKQNPSFLFYETNKNYVFASTDSLLSQKPMFEYVYSESSSRQGSGTDFAAEYKKILSIKTDTLFNYLDRLQSGMFASKLTLVNPISKTIEVVSSDYITNFPNHTHLDKFPLATPSVLRNQTSNLSFETFTPFVYDNVNVKSSQWKIQRKMLLAELNAIRFEIEVNGRTDIEVGKVVSIQMPSFTAINEGDRSSDINDTYYNGNYLVTAINHRINLTSHRMVMEIAKDSLGVQLKDK